MMYEELVKELRYLAKVYSICNNENTKEYNLAVKAADAIEELSKLADAIPHVCECCVGCELEKKNGGCDHGFVLSPKRAMQYLIKPRWIPVTEQLPEQDGQVLAVYTINTIPPIKRMIVVSFAKNLFEIDRYEFKNKPGFYSYDSEYGYYERIGITHWMPLPEPPKEDE